MSTLEDPRPMRLHGELLILSLSTILSCFVYSAQAEARTRCAISSPKLSSLSKKLRYAESPKAWRRIYQETSTALSIIEPQYDQLRDIDHDARRRLRAELTCAQELLLESAFYLSDDNVEGHLWSMRGIGHVVSLSSLNQRILRSVENKERLSLLLRRAKPKAKRRGRSRRATSSKQNRFGAWTSVYVSPQPKPYRLAVESAHRGEWIKRCGLISGCDDALKWRVYTQRDTELSFKLPAGDYRLSWSGACAQHAEDRSIKFAPEPTELNAPSMKCYSVISLVDSVTRSPVEQNDTDPTVAPQIKVLSVDPSSLRDTAGRVSAIEGSELLVTLRGYQDAKVTVGALGEPLNVKLKRCPVQLTVKALPLDAKVKAPKRVYWGRPYTVEVSRTGYHAISRSVTAPRPINCDQAPPHIEEVMLPREIEVSAIDPKGLRVKLNMLQVSGLSITPSAKKLYRPEGLYKVEAETEGYPRLSSRLKVSPCTSERCEKSQLQLKFEPPPTPPTRTATRLKWIGNGMLLTSLSLFSFNTFNDRERHLNGSFVDDLALTQQRMTSLNSWSLGLLIGGGITTLLGYAWPALTSSSGEVAPLETSSKRASTFGLEGE